jgi:hypothetical protein
LKGMVNPFGKIVVLFRFIEPGPQEPAPKMMVYVPEMDGEQMLSHFFEVLGFLPGCYAHQCTVFDGKWFNIGIYRHLTPTSLEKYLDRWIGGYALTLSSWRHSWEHRGGGTTQVVCTCSSFPSPMSNATGKLSNISPTDSALPAESTSLVITFRQTAGAPSGIITSVSCHICLPRGKSPS